MDKKAEAAAIKTALDQINKLYGKGSAMRLGDTDALDVEVIPTGIMSVDKALGVGGFPRGRIIEAYGLESGGKTTLTLHVIAQAQKMGGTAAFIDAEHSLDPTYARALGVNTDDLIISQPNNGEEALEIVELLVKSKAVDIIVVDSVAALVPKAELEGDMGQAQMGLQARLMSQAMRKLTAIVGNTSTCLVFINQIREKIGVMFGNPETTSGGRALKFYSSVRLDIRRGTPVKEGDVVVGFQSKIKVVKNKVAAPFREAEPMMVFGLGFDGPTDTLAVGAALKVVDVSGTWYAYAGERLGQGKTQAVQFLRDNPTVLEKLQADVRSKLFDKPKPVVKG